MAKINLDEIGKKSESPILKKRIMPGDVVSSNETEEKKSPLKKRTTPLDEPNAEKSVASLLTKRELPTEDKESSTPLLKKKSPLDTQQDENKEKSSLDKMRERIAAQKKLEQDMMTQQSLRNQEKVSMRNKLSALSKDLTEENEEEDITPKMKPVINSDLKTEALEMQNKKLKADLEKSKKQLQTLLALEYQDMRVLDSGSLTLSEEFIESLNNNVQTDLQENSEEQSLKDKIQELESLVNEKDNTLNSVSKTQEENNKQIELLKAKIQEQEKQIEENNSLVQEVTELKTKLSEQEKNYQSMIHEEIDKSLKQVSSLETQVNELNQKIIEKDMFISNSTEKNSFLQTEIDKSHEQISSLETKLNESSQTINEKDLCITNLNEKINSLPTEKDINELKAKVKDLETESQAKQKLESDYNLVLQENEQFKQKELLLQNELAMVKDQLTKLQISIQEEQVQKAQALSSLRQLNLEKAAIIEDEIKDFKNKLSENNRLVADLKFEYNKFVSARNQITSSFAVVRKYDKLSVETENANAVAKKLAEEIALLNPKADKKAYKAKVAESKSMTSKVDYLMKQLKKLAKNKNVIQYLKLIDSINEYETLFEDIDDRNKELQSSIDTKTKEVEVLKG